MNLKNNRRLYWAAAGLLLFLWGGWLLTQPFLPGTDGYYLLDQAGEILKSGALRIKNHDPTPFIIAGLIKLEIQSEFSVKLFLFFAGGVWFWLGRKAESTLFFWLTPLFLFHLIQFPKLTLSILIGVQALLWVNRRNQILFGLGSGLFHPLGFCAWGLAKLKNWKTWAPWVGSLALTTGLLLFGHFIRNQSFSLIPVGIKFLINSHFPLVFRICMGCWMGWMALNPSTAWLALGLLAPSSNGELFGATERWLLVLVLFSPWIVKGDKWKLVFAPVAAVIAWLMLQQMPKYDYKPLNDAILLSNNLNLKMLVVDQTGKFYFTAKTGKDAYFFEPEDGWTKDSIWRIAKNVYPGELLPFMNGNCGPGSNTWFTIRPNIMLIREDCWEGIRPGIRKEENEDLYDRVWDHTVNPSKKRPHFLDIRNE